MHPSRLLLPFFLFVSALLHKGWGQHRVVLEVTGLPAYHTEESAVFVAGSFNGWNPQSDAHRLQSAGKGRYRITLTLPAGTHAFKFTRGGWNRVEAGEEGKGVQNRVLQLNKDTSLGIKIVHWADHFPSPEKMSTASKQVQVLDSAFYMPQLNRSRRVWIYLPESYCSSRKRYPVLYMQDGQNVFDEATAFSGEWGVDEALDSLGEDVRECIVVAIDNGEETRISEYTPWDTEHGKGEGDLYVDFLVQTLKPFIDKKFRTRKKAKDTYIAGSSLGGLISFYAVLKHPEVFGGAGIFSPAFWIAPRLLQEVMTRAPLVKSKIYFYAGKGESKGMVPDLLAVFQLMNQYSPAKMTTVIRAEGEHSEGSWRQEFPLFYRWIMGEGVKK